MTAEEKIIYYVLAGIQAFVAIGALPVGYLFITHPDGSAVGMSASMLADSPFHDFFLPGIALFTFNGLFHLANALLCFFKYRFAPAISFILGFGLIIWIFVQVYSIGLNSILQPAFFAIGCAELILGAILVRRRNKR